ncbi:S-layer homology domain-containing protein [Sporosarcina sp. FA9]|uniref:S-layer homology domain-containing protein n=1 Tax=Sporosarcina sp. FA9 TaxID=3413030 RepID=UPI003F6578F7
MKKYSNSYQKLFKATLAATVATGAFVAVVPTFADAAASTLKDLQKGQDYYQDVLQLVERGVLRGFPDSTYKPNQAVTRGQAAKILANVLDLDTKNVKNPGFVDVKVTDEYYGAIAALAQNNIIKGFPDGTFGQGVTLKRSQMAKIIALGFELETETPTDTRFKDVKVEDEFAGYVQSLLTNAVTKGTTSTTFSPHSFVTRGQMASFVVRSEAAAQEKAEVISVTADSVELSTGTFKLSEDLKTLFNPSNLAALKGAVLEFTTVDDVITKVKSIEIKASGDAKNNVVLDGKKSTFAGNIVVNGDYVNLNNLTINGNLEIGKSVAHIFKADGVTVKGATNVSDKSVASALAKATSNISGNAVAFEVPFGTVLSTVAAEESVAQITFHNSVLGTVNLSQTGAVTLELRGTTKVGAVTVSSNVNLVADKGISIPAVTVTAGASNIKIDGNVVSLTISTPNSNITLGTNATIGNIVLPAGAKVENVIKNYSAVKGNIGQIGGVTNPDATPGTNVGGGGTGGGNSDETPSPSPYAAGNTALNSQLNAHYSSGSVITGFSGNIFTVKTSGNETLGHFETAAIDVFEAFDNTVVATVAVTFNLTFKNQPVIIPLTKQDVDSNIDFTEMITKALAKVNSIAGDLVESPIDRSTRIGSLKGDSIQFTVTGTIDTKAFADTYTFSFN